jgi:hypothetical protein
VRPVLFHTRPSSDLPRAEPKHPPPGFACALRPALSLLNAGQRTLTLALPPTNDVTARPRSAPPTPSRALDGRSVRPPAPPHLCSLRPLTSFPADANARSVASSLWIPAHCDALYAAHPRCPPARSRVLLAGQSDVPAIQAAARRNRISPPAAARIRNRRVRGDWRPRPSPPVSRSRCTVRAPLFSASPTVARVRSQRGISAARGLEILTLRLGSVAGTRRRARWARL